MKKILVICSNVFEGFGSVKNLLSNHVLVKIVADKSLTQLYSEASKQKPDIVYFFDIPNGTCNAFHEALIKNNPSVEFFAQQKPGQKNCDPLHDAITRFKEISAMPVPQKEAA